MGGTVDMLKLVVQSIARASHQEGQQLRQLLWVAVLVR
jgi:hypothetical protein